MQNQLAVVIPAYKGKFLEQTLDALCKQTNKNFNVYIGDDCSPDPISEIIEPFRSSLVIRFKRFDQNLGGKSLTGHWERCIELSENEPWIWLLPDDDVPDTNCVEEFFSHCIKNPEYNLFRFATINIDENNNSINKNNIPPVVEKNIDFLLNKYKHIRNSSLAEYIFKRKSYYNIGKFKEVPLAWGSDDILWYELSREKGIYTILGPVVKLRQSGINISSIEKIHDKKKLFASFVYIEKVKSLVFNDYNKQDSNILINEAYLFLIDKIKFYNGSLNIIELARIAIRLSNINNLKFINSLHHVLYCRISIYNFLSKLMYESNN